MYERLSIISLHHTKLLLIGSKVLYKIYAMYIYEPKNIYILNKMYIFIVTLYCVQICIVVIEYYNSSDYIVNFNA
jgi:hypothetical protein